MPYNFFDLKFRLNKYPVIHKIHKENPWKMQDKSNQIQKKPQELYPI